MLKKKLKHHHVISGGLFIGGLILGLYLIVGPSKESKSSAYVEGITLDENQSEEKFTKEIGRSVVDFFTGVHRIELTVQPGDTLSGLLDKAGVGGPERRNLVQSFKGVFDIRTLKPKEGKRQGDLIRVHYKDAEEEGLISVEKLEIYRTSVQRFYSEKKEEGFKAWEETFDPAVKVVRREGVIGEGQSFFSTTQAEGIPYNISSQFHEIFGFDLDFPRDVRAGAKFSVMYEEKYGPDGEYIGEGAFMFGSFENAGRQLQVYRYENESGKVAYYNEKGKGAQKALRKTPIKGARMSSGFGRRRHPILGYTRAHKGVDFAAGRGTPIPAAGAGRIVYRGRKGGYGNYIKIRHNGTYQTAYAHMHNFKRGLRVGSHVKQGQIIGYVGSTGRSTGPHLHYEILKNGRQVNPNTLRMPSVKSLAGKELKMFLAKKENVDMQFALLESDVKKYAQKFSE